MFWYNFAGQDKRGGELVQVNQTLVFEPEDVEVGLVPDNDFIAEFTPHSFRVSSDQLSDRLCRFCGL